MVPQRPRRTSILPGPGPGHPAPNLPSPELLLLSGAVHWARLSRPAARGWMVCSPYGESVPRVPHTSRVLTLPGLSLDLSASPSPTFKPGFPGPSQQVSPQGFWQPGWLAWAGAPRAGTGSYLQAPVSTLSLKASGVSPLDCNSSNCTQPSCH